MINNNGTKTKTSFVRLSLLLQQIQSDIVHWMDIKMSSGGQDDENIEGIKLEYA